MIVAMDEKLPSKIARAVALIEEAQAIVDDHMRSPITDRKATMDYRWEMLRRVNASDVLRNAVIDVKRLDPKFKEDSVYLNASWAGPPTRKRLPASRPYKARRTAVSADQR
jgi:hypothetical protein